MKLIASVLVSLLTFSAVFASSEGEEKEGFLTTKWCAERGLFRDCRIESVFCGYEGCYKDQKKFTTDINGKIVLYVHDEGKIYNINFVGGGAYRFR